MGLFGKQGAGALFSKDFLNHKESLLSGAGLISCKDAAMADADGGASKAARDDTCDRMSVCALLN